MGTWNSRDRETVSGTDFGDRMGVVADSSRNPLSTRSMWRATGADGAGFVRRYWLSPNSATACPLQGQIHMVAFLTAVAASNFVESPGHVRRPKGRLPGSVCTVS